MLIPLSLNQEKRDMALRAVHLSHVGLGPLEVANQESVRLAYVIQDQVILRWHECVFASC